MLDFIKNESMLISMSVELTTEQKRAREAMHRKSCDHRVRDRILCVLLSAQGWSATMIAQFQFIHETTVLRHIADYLDESKLNSDNGGSLEHLSSQQSAELRQYLTDMTQVTIAAIVAHVKARYSMSYSIPSMNKWLHRNGFTDKKPTGIPHKFYVEKQQQFVEKYAELKQNVGNDVPILFIDAVHPTQSIKLSYGWLPIGEMKIVETTGSRTRLNIIGALNLNNIAATIIREYPTTNAENICRFLIAIRETYPLAQKVCLILDDAPYHRTQKVKEWAYVMNIALHYLPPYSPNLNPIERLWKVMNEHARNNCYFPTAKTFRTSIRNFFTLTLPKIAGELTRRINDNFQILKSASSS